MPLEFYFIFSFNLSLYYGYRYEYLKAAAQTADEGIVNDKQAPPPYNQVYQLEQVAMDIKFHLFLHR